MSSSKRTKEEVEEVLDLYSDMVYKIALSYMKDVSHAEDVYQNTFLHYMESEKLFETEEHRKAWLIRVAFNECKKIYRQAFYRHSQPFEGSVMDLAAPEDSLEERFQKAVLQDAVLQAVMQLPLKYRKVIHLFYYEDLSVKEISKILQLRENTVTSQLSRARKLLKSQIDRCK